MLMKSLMTGLLCAFVVVGCNAAVSTEGDDGQDQQDETGDETVGTTQQAMKWTPRTDPWYNCLVGLQICRCSGNIIDCRNPIPIAPTMLSE
jgi:hypothetical protein